MTTITLGHVLLVLALIAAAATIRYTATALRYGRRFERGTPQYAEGRMARRSAFYSLGLALAFAALCLTPLCSVDLVAMG